MNSPIQLKFLLNILNYINNFKCFLLLLAFHLVISTPFHHLQLRSWKLFLIRLSIISILFTKVGRTGQPILPKPYYLPADLSFLATIFSAILTKGRYIPIAIIRLTIASKAAIILPIPLPPVAIHAPIPTGVIHGAAI